MKKFIKRLIKWLGITFGVLLLLIILIPILFGKQIKQAVLNYVNTQINAEVYMNLDAISISVFRNFPNITVSLADFGIIGKEEFKGDTLVDVSSLKVVVNLFSIFGDEYEVKRIDLVEPTIHVKVLKDGKANYDIMKPNTDSVVADTTPATPLRLALDSYNIEKGNIIYNDKAGDIYARISNLNHSGSGKFADTQYDFATTTSADSVTLRMAGTHYLRKALVKCDATVGIDNAAQKYTLKENQLTLNELTLGWDGWVQMKDKDIAMDLKFHTLANTFRNILSMVPGMYTKDFKDIQTDGTFTLDGNATGTFNEKNLPAFAVNLGVVNGWFQYPALPKKVSDINFDLKVNCPDGNLGNLAVNFPKFHCAFGSAPIDAKLILKGLTKENMDIDASVKAAVDLAEVLTIFPMEGQELKGKFSLDGTAKGKYNTSGGTFPTVNAAMKLENGYYKYSGFPSAIENMTLDASMKNENGSLEATYLDVRSFHGEIDKEPIDAALKVSNMANPAYDLKAHGKLNLEKLNKIYPIEGTTMKGIVQLDLDTKGVYSDVEKGNYANLPTSGAVTISQLSYKSAELPQGITVSEGNMDFTPKDFNIRKFSGTIGKSPVNITGALNNYLAYAMMPDQKLTGTMSLTSARFDVNEWMVEEDTPAPAATPAANAPAAPMQPYEVPGNIDFTFDCRIAEVTYDVHKLKDVAGRVIMRDKAVRFEQLMFGMLGGKFSMTGGYDTKDIAKPRYDMDFAVQNLDIQKTYEAFVTVQKLAPAAKFVKGNFNSKFNLSGLLGQDMYPDMKSLTSKGDAIVLDGTVTGMKILDEITNVTKLAQFKNIDLKDVIMLFEVKDGWFKVNPFDVAAGKTKMNVSGRNALDGAIDYVLKLDVPAGGASTAAVAALNGLTKGKMSSAENIVLDIGLGGTFDKPKITRVGSNLTGGVTDLVGDVKDSVQQLVQDKVEDVKDTAKAIVNNAIDDAKAKARAEADKILKEAEAQAAKIRAEGKSAADRVRAEANKKADETEKSAKNPLEKKAKQILADKIRKEGEDSAKKIESEANSKAQKVIDEARKRADAMLK